MTSQDTIDTKSTAPDDFQFHPYVIIRQRIFSGGYPFM